MDVGTASTYGRILFSASRIVSDVQLVTTHRISLNYDFFCQCMSSDDWDGGNKSRITHRNDAVNAIMSSWTYCRIRFSLTPVSIRTALKRFNAESREVTNYGDMGLK